MKKMKKSEGRLMRGYHVLTDPVTKKTLGIDIEIYDGHVIIHSIDYGENTAIEGQGRPIMIEYYEGELRVILWSDINQEEPTHIVSMEGAKESKRVRE